MEREFDAHHKTALKDNDVERDPNNIEPRDPQEDNEYHRGNGDFSRWRTDAAPKAPEANESSGFESG
jgi:hypothetical protein